MYVIVSSAEPGLGAGSHHRRSRVQKRATPSSGSPPPPSLSPCCCARMRSASAMSLGIRSADSAPDACRSSPTIELLARIRRPRSSGVEGGELLPRLSPSGVFSVSLSRRVRACSMASTSEFLVDELLAECTRPSGVEASEKAQNIDWLAGRVSEMGPPGCCTSCRAGSSAASRSGCRLPTRISERVRCAAPRERTSTDALTGSSLKIRASVSNRMVRHALAEADDLTRNATSSTLSTSSLSTSSSPARLPMRCLASACSAGSPFGARAKTRIACSFASSPRVRDDIRRTPSKGGARASMSTSGLAASNCAKARGRTPQQAWCTSVHPKKAPRRKSRRPYHSLGISTSSSTLSRSIARRAAAKGITLRRGRCVVQKVRTLPSSPPSASSKPSALKLTVARHSSSAISRCSSRDPEVTCHTRSES
mmetsp:Transcript_34708/g.86589  ORF Transcript_34708/g.86589 Transcript_34708/m.86589 type:complete len:424 (+) Transcript_34708:550-1821(+)